MTANLTQSEPSHLPRPLDIATVCVYGLSFLSAGKFAVLAPGEFIVSESLATLYGGYSRFCGFVSSSCDCLCRTYGLSFVAGRLQNSPPNAHFNFLVQLHVFPGDRLWELGLYALPRP